MRPAVVRGARPVGQFGGWLVAAPLREPRIIHGGGDGRLVEDLARDLLIRAVRAHRRVGADLRGIDRDQPHLHEPCFAARDPRQSELIVTRLLEDAERAGHHSLHPTSQADTEVLADVVMELGLRHPLTVTVSSIYAQRCAARKGGSAPPVPEEAVDETERSFSPGILGHPGELEVDQLKAHSVERLISDGASEAASALVDASLRLEVTDDWGWFDDYIYDVRVTVAGVPASASMPQIHAALVRGLRKYSLAKGVAIDEIAVAFEPL